MEPIGFLKELVSIPSPSGDEDAAAEYLVRHMAGLGFQVHRDEVGNVVGSIGNAVAERSIVLLGHLDTVPGAIPLREAEGRLYGRGTVDAKGSLAAFVVAASKMASRLEKARVIVIGAVEEEAHGRGARYLARTMRPPYCVIIGEPSYWEGITLGYKGMISFDYQLTQPGGHSAGERPGPAERAVTFWNHLVMYAEERNGGRSGHFDTVDPALREFSTFSDGLNDGVEMNVVVRLPPGLPLSDLKRTIQLWSDGATVRFLPSDAPFLAEKNTPLVRALLRAIRAEGGRPRFKLKTGTSDMNIIGPAWNCPIVAYGPGDSSMDHTPWEYIEIREFHRAIDVLTRALETLVN